MSKLSIKRICILTAALVFSLFRTVPSLSAADKKTVSNKSQVEVVDPHFTGRDCDVCHAKVPKAGQKDLWLKFEGDDVEMCNSCHMSEYVKGDFHPVGSLPVKGDSVTIPDALPLYGGRVTCRTCHDVYMQCSAQPSIQFENINFLRGAPYKKTTDICFRCHNRDDYKKTNPHEQKDADGNVLKQQCLYCHQSFADPDTVSDMDQVAFKTDTSTFCAACHGEEESFHPANTNHMRAVSEDMVAVIKDAEKKYGVILPLFKGKIFCGTCHNPHDSGIIIRDEASKGSDKEYKLRLDWSYDLCVACHIDKEGLRSQEIKIKLHDMDPSLQRHKEVPHYHKSFVDKKCRACHSITRENSQRPTVYKTCFQADCHDASLVGKTFSHTDAREGNCLLCHNAHGSLYGAHILNDQQKLCKACHPLFGKRDEEAGAGEDLHGYYLALMKKLVPDREITCSGCHGENHGEKILETGIGPCYRCHNYIKELISGKKDKPKDVHDTFKRTQCSECHEPHSSDYQYLLKEEPETYR